ncbi:MAG: glycosyl hydrolase family 8 [Myxococcota bacterium]
MVFRKAAIGLSGLAIAFGLALGCGRPGLVDPDAPPDPRIERMDLQAALWSFYRFHYIVDGGRVVSLDEDGITTSEGQSYAMLRSVWSDDRETFDAVWAWTQRHLRREEDGLFSWKWKAGVLDRNAATDADTDVALALLLAARRFEEPAFEREALAIVRAIWDEEVLVDGEACLLTAGNWSKRERVPVLHVGYFAPYAYREFAKLDRDHDWSCVASTAYDVLRLIFVERDLDFPPERVYYDRKNRRVRLEHPKTLEIGDFGYDAFPIYWRLAADWHWSWRLEGELRARMLAPLHEAYVRDGARLFDRYRPDGAAKSRLEALPLYATAHALADVVDPAFAERLRREKLEPLWRNALVGRDTPYYLHNWLAFDELLSLGLARPYGEWLSFLLPFDGRAFYANLPKVPLAACLGLFPLVLLLRGTRAEPVLRAGFLAAAFAVCGLYLVWRARHSLNFIEPAGPWISVGLFAAELYCFVSVALLVVQTGLGGPRGVRRPEAPGFAPSVDVFIPIFREPLEILDRTLVAARAMDYPNARVHVLDDGHRPEVRALAERHGATYHEGPRRHAKAGNLNQALARTDGELCVVFDTDHVPTRPFLARTVPFFQDRRMGFVQTPHHFRNPDVFQHAFRAAGRIPNEQDMFNHGIQSERDRWGGTFFVGSGAVFRREALESVGGFKLLSITEDIHTSQHLHARGWRSAFVDEDLAVGLSAENLASYIVQRRRWMLGCLQIFFRDNPLFCRGLSPRQRLGYFASLYHFFYPLPRLIFWLTPLAYLFFHWHPILADVAILTAYLIPYLLVLPMISAVLIPGWSRPLWGSFYESAVSAPLARSILDLLLPKSLGFQVTPKGITSQAHRFDWASARWTLVLAVGMALGLAKGTWELVEFGVERDAYVFNLAWCGLNLVFLLAGLMIAWERPQRRVEDRVRRAIPVRIALAPERGGSAQASCAGGYVVVSTGDVGLGGCALDLDRPLPLPDRFPLELMLEVPLRIEASLAYQERRGRRTRAGLRFEALDEAEQQALLLAIFADARTWARAHEREARHFLSAIFAFGRAFAGYVLPGRAARRRHPRRRGCRTVRVRIEGREARAWLRDRSPRGLGLRVRGAAPASDARWRIVSERGGDRWGRTVYVRRSWHWLWSVGIELGGDGEVAGADAEKREDALVAVD